MVAGSHVLEPSPAISLSVLELEMELSWDSNLGPPTRHSKQLVWPVTSKLAIQVLILTFLLKDYGSVLRPSQVLLCQREVHSCPAHTSRSLKQSFGMYLLPNILATPEQVSKLTEGESLVTYQWKILPWHPGR